MTRLAAVLGMRAIWGDTTRSVSQPWTANSVLDQHNRLMSTCAAPQRPLLSPRPLIPQNRRASQAPFCHVTIQASVYDVQGPPWLTRMRSALPIGTRPIPLVPARRPGIGAFSFVDNVSRCRGCCVGDIYCWSSIHGCSVSWLLLLLVVHSN